MENYIDNFEVESLALRPSQRTCFSSLTKNFYNLERGRVIQELSTAEGLRI
jgi:hypothetical protein